MEMKRKTKGESDARSGREGGGNEGEKSQRV